MHSYDYLIVGGGMTADAAARGIREVDPAATIGIVSSEPDAPYSRPPLTKALWKGDSESTVWRGTETVGATLHLDRTVKSLDPEQRVITDSSGDSYKYRELLLATGGTPRRLPFPAEGVIYFRTLQDYRRLRHLADERERFIVLGGGFIGSEIAAALSMNGKSVTMVIPEDGIGARVFPADLSRFLVEYFRGKRVAVQLGTSVASARTTRDEMELTTNAGTIVAGHVAVAGLGITPNVELARQGGLAIADGIPVDDRLRTSQEHVFAAGDVANFLNPALGERLRVEHEDNALTMGRAAGQSMAGANASYHHLPFFYSDLFELGYEAVGRLDSRLETVADWKEPHRQGVVYYLGNGRVRGVLLWNVWGQVDAARVLIAERGPFDATKLRGRIG
jgi:3-phenylpropionate/trans-cinnamate dioxygenase ferredoxin reductase component